jgi:protein-tyrosine phosphatase
MGRFEFAAARPEEVIVYGAQRPGYPSKNVDVSDVRAWISFVQKSGIRRVCCLLPTKQLAYYRVDLLQTYREAFGQQNVCRAEVEDYHLCDHATLENTILPFLVESDRASTPVVIHCSGGSGRTGHVLAAWLVRHRGLSVDDALAIVSTNRNPREAVHCGHATEKELRCLLAGVGSRSGG